MATRPLSPDDWAARAALVRDLGFALERYCIRKKFAADARAAGDPEAALAYELAAAQGAPTLPPWVLTLPHVPVPPTTRKERP